MALCQTRLSKCLEKIFLWADGEQSCEAVCYHCSEFKPYQVPQYFGIVHIYRNRVHRYLRIQLYRTINGRLPNVMLCDMRQLLKFLFLFQTYRGNEHGSLQSAVENEKACRLRGTSCQIRCLGALLEKLISFGMFLGIVSKQALTGNATEFTEVLGAIAMLWLMKSRIFTKMSPQQYVAAQFF